MRKKTNFSLHVFMPFLLKISPVCMERETD